MYGKTYKLHNSPALAPAEALLVSSSPAFDGLHDDINFFILACFYRKLLKKRQPHGEREPTISVWIIQVSSFSSVHINTFNCIQIQYLSYLLFMNFIMQSDRYHHLYKKRAQFRVPLKGPCNAMKPCNI